MGEEGTIIAVLLVLGGLAAVVMNVGGLRDKLGGFKNPNKYNVGTFKPAVGSKNDITKDPRLSSYDKGLVYLTVLGVLADMMKKIQAMSGVNIDQLTNKINAKPPPPSLIKEDITVATVKALTGKNYSAETTHAAKALLNFYKIPIKSG